MNRFLRAVLAAMFFFSPALALGAAGRLVEAPVDAALAGKLEGLTQLLDAAVAEGEAPGCSLLLAVEGRVVYEKAFGLADVEEKKPFTIKTLAPLASSTKPISSTGVMILADEGKISLDDPVDKYIPSLAGLKLADGQPARPTIRQMLTHTAGLAPLVQTMRWKAFRGVRSLDLAAHVDLYPQEPLINPPGKAFNYSVGHQVAARVVEVVTGKNFADYMRQRVFEPLGMSSSGFTAMPEELAPLLCASYRQPEAGGFVLSGRYNTRKKPDEIFFPQNLVNVKLIRADGGMYSGLRDLAAFLQMHLNGGVYNGARLLSPEAARQTHQVMTDGVEMQSMPPETGDAYALGWAVLRRDKEGRSLTIEHGGALGPVIWIDFDRDLVGVLLVNLNRRYVYPLHRRVQQKVLEIFSPRAHAGQ